MNGLASLRATANVGRGNFVRNVFEEIDGGALQVRDDLGRVSIFGFFLSIRPGHEIGWDNQAQSFGADPRAIGNDEITETEERFVLLPHGNVEKRVGADHEKNAVAMAMIDVTKVTNGVHGIVQLGAAKIFAGFRERRDEMRVLGVRERDHGESVREGREVLFELVRRPAGGDEMDFVKVKTAVSSAGDG